MRTRPTVIVPVRDRAAFLDLYFEKGTVGGIFVDGELDLPLGEVVDVEVHFVSEAIVFRIEGQVRWRRAGSTERKSVPQGVGIEFLPDEQRAHQLLVDFARGKDVPLVQRAARRYGIGIPVRYRAESGVASTDVTDDLSEGGAFIESEQRVEVGDHVKVKLLPPGALFGVGVPGVVAWRREDGRRGFGVQFIYDSPRTRARVQRLIDGIKARVLHKARSKHRV